MLKDRVECEEVGKWKNKGKGGLPRAHTGLSFRKSGKSDVPENGSKPYCQNCSNDLQTGHAEALDQGTAVELNRWYLARPLKRLTLRLA